MTAGDLPPDARADFEAIIDHYIVEANFLVAERFYDAAVRTLNFIRDFPVAGSPRLGVTIRNARARCWPVEGFPYVVIYIVRNDRPEILRILHTARDIPSLLHDRE
ncbi:MAG: type II toxin-antitoxin system RelE/ParE family toxin [Gemmobacter sp.]